MSAQRMLPVADWPAADRDGWTAAITGGASLLDEAGAAAHLSACARDDYERRYGYFLDWARRQGRLSTSGAPAATVTPENVAAYMAEMEIKLSSVTLAQSVRKILRVAGILAPATDWSWLRRVSARLEQRIQPADKRARLIESDRLYALGMTLMDEAEAALAVPRRSRHRVARRAPRVLLGPSITMAQTYRDGLMIALLTASSVRCGNLTGQEVARTLVRRPGGWWIEIAGPEVKNRRPILIPLPKALALRIDRYLACFRPVFPSSDMSASLWFSRLGQPLSQSAVYQIITRRTRKHLGRAVNPHLFRDAAITTLALRHGAHMWAGSAMLGHVDPETTRKHYNQASMIDAVRRFQTVALSQSGATIAPRPTSED